MFLFVFGEPFYGHVLRKPVPCLDIGYFVVLKDIIRG